MILVEKTDLSDTVYLIPLGDVHLGSPQCNWKKFIGYVNWIKERPNAYSFIMGDMFDTATRDGVTEMFGQTLDLNTAIDKVVETLTPIKKQILGAVTGNHEKRLVKYATFNPLKEVMSRLRGKKEEEDDYCIWCNHSAVIRFRVGRYERKDGRVSPNIEYVFYAHHTTGGGSTEGGKLNRVEKLHALFEGADAYLGGHNHFIITGKPSIAHLSKSGNGKATLKFRRIQDIDCGSFMEWNESYAEGAELPPGETGAVRIRMNGLRKDLHVST